MKHLFGGYELAHRKRGPTLKQQAAEEGITLRQLQRRLYKQRHPEKFAEDKKRYRADHPGRAWEKWKEKQDPGRLDELRERSSRAWRLTNLGKVKAHNAVARALRKGTLVRQTCARCGRFDTVAHHESYAIENWLRVVWLCKGCHKERHLEIDAEKLDALLQV